MTIKIAFPFEIFFTFLDFRSFSEEHNFLIWDDFNRIENLKIIEEGVTNFEILKEVFSKRFQINTESSIPTTIIFKKQIKRKINDKWFAIKMFFSKNKESSVLVKFIGSTNIKEKTRESVKEWIFSILRIKVLN